MLQLSGSQFKKTNEVDFIKSISEKNIAEPGQISSWSNTYHHFLNIVNNNNKFDDVEFIFEYSLPFTNGKRPDVLMFVRNRLYIIEYKNRSTYKSSDLDQLKQYFEFITNYHSGSHMFSIYPILLLESDFDMDELVEGLYVFKLKWTV